jgi:hypothetical protein
MLAGMEKAEIKQIADYLKDLEEGLYEWDYCGMSTLGHLDIAVSKHPRTGADRPG